MMAYPGRSVAAADTGNIQCTAAILKRTRLLVSIDTGVMHLGAALGVPTVGIFGPTRLPLGTNRPAHDICLRYKATCSPCVNNYSNRTPSHCINVDRVSCMCDVNPQSVLTAARRVVGSHFLG